MEGWISYYFMKKVTETPIDNSLNHKDIIVFLIRFLKEIFPCFIQWFNNAIKTQAPIVVLLSYL